MSKLIEHKLRKELLQKRRRIPRQQTVRELMGNGGGNQNLESGVIWRGWWGGAP